MIQEPYWDYNKLDQRGFTIVEYIWLGGKGDDLRSKARSFNKEITSVDQLPVWNFDGSSTYQAQTESSEVEIVPVALFNDPFRGAPNKLAFCETRYNKDKNTLSNFRHFARQIFSEKNCKEHEPWFGIEQEYILTKRVGTQIDWILGWPVGNFPEPQGMYYCGVGAKYVYGREICEAHYRACLNAGVDLYGINAEVCPGQWEFQVGTSKGIDIGDHLWMARWLLHRVGEKFDVDVTFEPKPIKGWNGTGAHCNYSNNGSRNDTNMKDIEKQLEGMAQHHMTCQRLYGVGNEERLSGGFETSAFDKFTWGVMSRSSSVRIPQQTKDNGKGYYEDRRPSGNVDPYIVSSLIFSATCLNGFLIKELEEQYTQWRKAYKEITGK